MCTVTWAIALCRDNARAIARFASQHFLRAGEAVPCLAAPDDHADLGGGVLPEQIECHASQSVVGCEGCGLFLPTGHMREPVQAIPDYPGSVTVSHSHRVFNNTSQFTRRGLADRASQRPYTVNRDFCEDST